MEKNGKRLLTHLKKIMVPILKNSNVKRAAIFGSAARGEMKKDSDIDLLVEISGEKTLFDLIGLKQELEEAVGKRIDLIQYSCIHPAIKKSVLREQKVIL